MTDNINKLSKNVDSSKPQQTAASIVNLSDDGEIDINDCFNRKLSHFIDLDKEHKKNTNNKNTK